MLSSVKYEISQTFVLYLQQKRDTSLAPNKKLNSTKLIS